MRPLKTCNFAIFTQLLEPRDYHNGKFMLEKNELLGKIENFIYKNEFSDFHSIYEVSCLHLHELNLGRRNSTEKEHNHK